jgi:hypothetical protein
MHQNAPLCLATLTRVKVKHPILFLFKKLFQLLVFQLVFTAACCNVHNGKTSYNILSREDRCTNVCFV